MGKLIIKLHGHHPVPWGQNQKENKKTDKWRQRIAEKCKLLQSEVQRIESQTTFNVEIVFYLKNNKSDLDNLAKPVIDTLFHPSHTQVKDLSFTGVLFPNINDKHVIHLELWKRFVRDTKNEGVDILISW